VLWPLRGQDAHARCYGIAARAHALRRTKAEKPEEANFPIDQLFNSPGQGWGCIPSPRRGRGADGLDRDAPNCPLSAATSFRLLAIFYEKSA